MRIAINTLPAAPGATGIGAYAQALAHAAVRFSGRHSFAYLTGQGSAELPLPDRDGLRRLVVDSPSPLWEQLRLPSELASWGVDLYHSPLFTCPIVDEVPSVVTVHDIIPAVRPDLCTKQFLEFWRSRIGPSLRAAQWVVTTSDFSRQEAMNHLGIKADRIRTIYQGVGPQFRPEAAEGHAIPGLPERA